MGSESINYRGFGNELLTNLLGFAAESITGALGLGLSIAADMSNDCVTPVDAGNAPSAPPGTPRTVAAVGVAAQLDPAQWAQGTGPLWEAFRSGNLVQVSQLSLDAVPPEVLTQVRGAVFSAGEWGGELPVVLSVYLDRPADAKVLRDMDLYEPVVTQALSLVEYCAGEQQVAQQMLQMTQYRRVIEQAKGLIMGAASGDAASAFATLARASQHFNVRLRNLAVALVEHVGGGTAEHPDDPKLVIEPSDSEREIAARVWAALTTTAILPPGTTPAQTDGPRYDG